jgi:hypothetical protein
MYKRKKHSTGDNNWYCKECDKDCFIDDKDYYMVKHEIWSKVGVGKGMLCMDCIETKIGHKLTKDDIIECPLTTLFNPYTANILNN